ncbi:hypothetical protein DOM22_10880 [Bdellovibrio sp. ZAP7]|uniref:hypothetical protein n=1 Tax=Bdellovibrio sp. ZAP7 TaxID=2231053 RepID=UPI001157A0B9|nr:hypothetical protein [Bdellovibrio sp. ZAP7]QDK45615.1 hypothetical protein DOM22_10880 [Bdellovibrio sp. ZAP7]
MPNFEKAAKVQVWLLYGPFLIPLVLMLIHPVGVLGFVGAWFVIKSKVSSKLRSKKLIEWGSASMSSKERVSYRIGWGVIGLALTICILLKFLDGK